MQKFDILDPKLNIFQNRFLEASAGTGKTFAIEHLVIRLLLESKEPIELSQILAVTFTREAAHEMKTRIRSKLESLNQQKNPRVRDALIQFDEIQVFTIHGFCHRMLTEFAFEAKAPLLLNAPDQPNHLQEMRQTVKDFFRTADHSCAFETTALLKRFRFDIDRLVDKIVEAMQKDETPLQIPLPEVPSINLTDLKNDFLLLAPRYKRLKVEEFTLQIEKFAEFLNTKDSSLLLGEKEWFFEKMHEENAKVKAKPLHEYSLKVPGFFEQVHTVLVPYLKGKRNPEEMLKKMGKECAKRWRVKAARGDHFTFDDLLHKMDQALSNPPFLEKVGAKYKAVIVDEFQDTDPIQWRIFEQLFLKHHLLYLVGDPKQSIYGFRNADIYTYMKAANALGQENKAVLDTNFRSSPQLIEALNQLFTKRPDWIALPSLPNALNYYPVKAGKEENKLTETPIHYFGVEGRQGREKNWPTKQMEEEKLFPFIASEIIRLHHTHNISFSEMAILIKDRFQGQRLQLHLNLWKIPSTIKRTFNLAESRGFSAMQLLLKALHRPENDRHVRAVLYGPLQCREETNFFLLKEYFQEKGFASFFTEFLTHYSHAHNDPSLYLELRQTAEILMEQYRAGLEELIHLMDELKKLNPEIDERLKLQSDEGEDAAAIMTTFASKGLEFEIVFALGLASHYFEEENNPEKNAEKMRQLYVAFTRSKEKLYIPILKKEEPSSTFHSPIELFFEDQSLPIQWVDKIAIQPCVKTRQENEISPPPIPHLTFKEEYLTSFSSMAKPHSNTLLAETFQLQDLKIKTAHTLPLGAETGTIIHSVFEGYFQNPTSSLEQLICEVVIGTHLEGWEEVIINMVNTTLNMSLIDHFSLSELKEGDYFQEMEFLFPQNQQLIKGFIDLVFRREDHFYIVDWKTNWLGPSNEDYTSETLHKAMEEHEYPLQAKLYQEAIQRYVKRLYKNPQFGGAYYIFVRGKGVAHVGPC